LDTYDYTRAAATSLKLLTKFGQAVTLRKFGPGAYVNGAITPSETDYTIKGAVFDYPRMNFGEVLQDGALVAAGDRNLFLAANSARPELNDHAILADGGEWNIVAVKPLNPANVPVMYDCRIRQ